MTTRELALTIATECPCLRLRGAARVMTRVYDAALRKVNLQTSQLTLLVGTAAFGDAGAPLGSLAAAIAMERTTLTRNVRPLVKQGYLTLERDENDGRSRRLRLTSAGEAALRGAYPLWKRAMLSTERSLGADRTAALGTMLSDVLQLTPQSK